VPFFVGEPIVGILLGRTGLGTCTPATFSFPAQVGFGLVKFVGRIRATSPKAAEDQRPRSNPDPKQTCCVFTRKHVDTQFSWAQSGAAACATHASLAIQDHTRDAAITGWPRLRTDAPPTAARLLTTSPRAGASLVLSQSASTDRLARACLARLPRSASSG
jgi:hypothetical protein